MRGDSKEVVLELLELLDLPYLDVCLLGAMVGGLVEYAALAVGYRALLIVVALVYGMVLLTVASGADYFLNFRRRIEELSRQGGASAPEPREA
jgi:hypothetical protein